MSSKLQPLLSRVAVVAGATRGGGRAIAVELGAAGATVICTGRTTLSHVSDLGRKGETIEGTAELVNKAGGVGVAMQCDHTVSNEVKDLFETVLKQYGKVDILVNSVWGCDSLIEWDKKFYELEDISRVNIVMQRALTSHMLTNRYGVPSMVASGSGLVVEVTDGCDLRYRGQILYDLVKTTVMRLALSMAIELKGTGVTALAITPGFLRSEAMLEHFGVTADSWRDAIAKDPFFEESETPHFLGRAIAALAADKDVNRFAGNTLASWDMAREYNFYDIDGRRPHWAEFFEKNKGDMPDMKAAVKQLSNY